MLITGLDTETTGLDYQKGHRIIEINMQTYKLETRQRLINITDLINNDGKTIDKKAQAVHGISAGDLIGKPVFKLVAPKIHKVLSRSHVVVTHNGNGFDLPFIAHEMAQAGLELPSHLVSVDTMVDGMFASYDTKSPSLAELCYACGIEYDHAKAHAAEYDVAVMMDCFFVALDEGLVSIDLPQADAA